MEIIKYKAERLPVKAKGLLPHGPSMIFVDELIEKTDDKATVSAIVPRDGIFVEDGARVHCEYLVELMAQAIAAADGYDARNKSEQKERIGFVVGVESMHFLKDVHPGDPLTVKVSKQTEVSNVTFFAGQILDADDNTIVYGTLKVWRSKNFSV